MPLDQPHLPGSKHQKQEELWSCNLQKGDHKHTKSDKMGQQRNMLPIKEQDKNLQKQLNGEAISNLSEK